MDRTRALPIVAALLLVVAACTNLPALNDTTTTEAQSGEAPMALLLLLDQDNAVVVVDRKGTVIERSDPPPDVRYAQPIWGSSETIVRAQIAIDDNRLIATRLGGGSEWSVQLPTVPFYYLAQPGNEIPTVVSLRTDDRAGGLIAEVIAGPSSVDTVSNESPFYMSWDPTSNRLATHVGGDRLDIVDGGSETISTTANGFQAPVWLEEGLVTLRTGSGETFLTLWDGSSFVDLATVQSAARFVGAGNRIAIQTGATPDGGGVRAIARAQALPTIPSGVLMVVDIETGSFTSVTSDASPFYQWDAGGTRLLFATLARDLAPALQWHVWEDGTIEDFAVFIPDPSWFQSVIPFFDQYAQSISLWAPDGSAFAYPALVDGEPRILVQGLDNTSPSDIAGGIWVTWAPATANR
ncbi:hypothetical protein MNBD_ACTINO01-1049 [hydrothermal vent metagenome]|uniref:Lipoprotein n=1 Tax=hydrothermal vent metagenome TaxID=652676 RepID=A0A3B0TGY8_9ZZZZ